MSALLFAPLLHVWKLRESGGTREIKFPAHMSHLHHNQNIYIYTLEFIYRSVYLSVSLGGFTIQLFVKGFPVHCCAGCLLVLGKDQDEAKVTDTGLARAGHLWVEHWSSYNKDHWISMTIAYVCLIIYLRDKFYSSFVMCCACHFQQLWCHFESLP